MEIVWYGLNCFRLAERGMASVVTDPYDPSVGLSLPRVRADIITVSRSSSECSHTRAVRGPYRVLDAPGEYEIGGAFVTAIATYADKRKGASRGLNTVFHFDYNGLTICHLGHLGHVPTQAQIEALGTVDILLTPVGGHSGLSAAEASEVVSLLEPSIVVPMRYKLPGLSLSLGTLSGFLRQMGSEKAESREALKASRGSLPDQTEIVVLTPHLE